MIKERGVEAPQTTCHFGTQGAASNELAELFGLEESPFSSPKPVGMIEDFILRFVNDNDIVLDFFSGSATTAHATMRANVSGIIHGVKYILVQIEEDLDKSLAQAQKDAVRTLEVGIDFLNSIGKEHTICEIGKERIRRAAKKIHEDNPDAKFDDGFRVLKLDDSNMNDVYYAAGDYTQDLVSMLEFNVKPDRTDLDLLFGCLLDWGLPLSLSYTSETIDGCKVHTYNDGDLIACFDENVPESVIKTIAKRQPLRAVFRDFSFASSPEKINVGEIFKLLAPDTRVKVI